MTVKEKPEKLNNVVFPEFKRISWETWLKKYKPRLDGEGQPIRFETYGTEYAEVLKAYKKNKKLIWTQVTGDSGKDGLSSGYHYVNRIVYYICEVPYDKYAKKTEYWVRL